jgi:MFS family permease
MFRNGNLAFYAGAGSLFSGVLLLTLFLQELRSLSALQAGLVAFPLSVGTMVAIPLVGRLYPIVGPRRLITAGMLTVAVTSLLMLRVDVQTDLRWISVIMFLRGVAFAFCIIPVQAATYATTQPRNMGRATSLFSTGRQVGTSLAIGVLITVLTTRTQTHVAAAVRSAGDAARAAATQHGAVLGFHDAFAVSALLSLVGVAVALLIHDGDAAATMRRTALQPVAVEPVASAEPVVSFIEPAA